MLRSLFTASLLYSADESALDRLKMVLGCVGCCLTTLRLEEVGVIREFSQLPQRAGLPDWMSLDAFVRLTDGG